MIPDVNNSWINPSFSTFPMNINYGAMNPVAAAISAQPTTGVSAVANAPIAGAGNIGGVGGFGQSGFGFNLPTAQLALGGLQTIGGLWNAFEAQKLAKKQFAFTKDVTETNLRNSIQAYNTTLEDRGRSRAFTEGQSAETAQAYIDNNRLRR